MRRGEEQQGRTKRKAEGGERRGKERMRERKRGRRRRTSRRTGGGVEKRSTAVHPPTVGEGAAAAVRWPHRRRLGERGRGEGEGQEGLAARQRSGDDDEPHDADGAAHLNRRTIRACTAASARGAISVTCTSVLLTGGRCTDEDAVRWRTAAGTEEEAVVATAMCEEARAMATVAEVQLCCGCWLLQCGLRQSGSHVAVLRWMAEGWTEQRWTSELS